MSTPQPVSLTTDDHALVQQFVNAREQGNSRETYGQVAGALLTWHQARQHPEPTPLAQLTRNDAVTYYSQRLNPLHDGEPSRAPATVRRDLAILSALFSFLADHDLRDPDHPNPFWLGGRIPNPARTTSDPANRPTLTASQIARLVPLAKDLGPDEHFLIVLVGLMGQPVHGIQQLTGDDVPPTTGNRPLIHLRARRGARSWQPLVPELRETIDLLRTDDPTAPLLRSPRGQQINRRGIGVYFRQITAHATAHGLTLPPLNSGLLHRTFIVLAHQGGASLEDIQRITGQLDGGLIAMPDPPGTSVFERVVDIIRRADH